MRQGLVSAVRWTNRIVLYLVVFMDLSVVGQIIFKLITGGPRRVKAWIFHLAGFRTVLKEKGEIELIFPSPSEVYRVFAIFCASLVLVTVACWYLDARLSRKAKDSGGRGASPNAENPHA
jgi:hypothetical protein